MEITWYGHSCFRLTERNFATVVTDPFDSKTTGYDSLKLKAEIVTVSHDAPGHNNSDVVKGTTHVITGAGEIEIGGGVIHSAANAGAAANRQGEYQRPDTSYDCALQSSTVAHVCAAHANPR